LQVQTVVLTQYHADGTSILMCVCPCIVVYRCMHREVNQLHTTEWFIALIICSTCFRHFYAHHQELETILVLLPWLLVVGGQVQGSRLCVRDEGGCSISQTICGNNTSTVSRSWWWAQKCPKHVEQIIRAINHPVAFSWFTSLRKLYYFPFYRYHFTYQYHVNTKKTSQLRSSDLRNWQKTGVHVSCFCYAYLTSCPIHLLPFMTL
jgi:hypothetical protein